METAGIRFVLIATFYMLIALFRCYIWINCVLSQEITPEMMILSFNMNLIVRILCNQITITIDQNGIHIDIEDIASVGKRGDSYISLHEVGVVEDRIC